MARQPGIAESLLGQSIGPPKGWYSRGYLPHRDHPGLLQSITYHLADSLPAEALARLDEKLRLADPQRLEVERRKRLEDWLDAGHGCCAPLDPRAASCVVDTWHRFAEERYDLIAWVVMPNHVHVLVRVYEGIALWKIVQSWKSFTGRRIASLMLKTRCHTDVLKPGIAESNVEQAQGNPSNDVHPENFHGAVFNASLRVDSIASAIRRNPRSVGCVPSTVASPSWPNNWSPCR